MSAIGPGDWIERWQVSNCPDCAPIGYWKLPEIPVGAVVQVYTVISAVLHGWQQDALEIVGYEEIGADGWRESYTISDFRPISRSTEVLTLLEKLKTGAPVEPVS